MPCLLVLVALFFPRVVLFFIWLLTDWTSTFETHIWPLIGWVFMPFTTLMYLWASCATDRHINGGWVFLILLGVILDFASWASSASR